MSGLASRCRLIVVAAGRSTHNWMDHLRDENKVSADRGRGRSVNTTVEADAARCPNGVG